MLTAIDLTWTSRVMVTVCHIVFSRRTKVRRYHIGHTYGVLQLPNAVGMTDIVAPGFQPGALLL